MINKKSLVEAALFVSNKPLSARQLSYLLSIPLKEVEEIIEEMERELKKEDRGIMLLKTPEGYELVVKPEYRQYVQKIAPFSELSEGVKKTLAIIVAKQPVKQSTIVKIQGNKVYDYLKILEKKGLIKSEKFGRTKVISLTKNFEEYFGKSVEEIKKELLEGTKS
ncbi:MAG: SMC-Scp complex subunit ScpB [Candidatus Aenigmarchaeota archaeon]|nr:SMC-Scp complex subunit ScpB [Candidatus Aenigmarchaeota archaeon]MCX8190966.1 SMC-Scp complex subunit ScpB [Candidatus Aenigmarchaeota archaeon]MDW8160239.1 SMC-Scp complex subunit ScpB [Candidatus Aenigmarchaeota archaeon]